MAPTTTFVHGFLRLCLLGGWHRGSGVLVTHCAAGSDSADRASGSKNTIHKCPSPKSPVRFLRREWTAAVRVRVPSCANRRWREWPSPQGKPKAWKKMEKRLKGRGTDHWSMEGCEHGRTCWVDGPKQAERSKYREAMDGMPKLCEAFSFFLCYSMIFCWWLIWKIVSLTTVYLEGNRVDVRWCGLVPDLYSIAI